jgi:uncharacterized membrane protein YedE/YeeE
VNALVALASGLLFGLGLIVSGMADPSKVLAFLDLAGAWDPSLGFVMAGAIGVALPAYARARRARRTRWLGAPLHWPPPRAIDARLIGGSVVFGIGWGLIGFCPGPAVVALGMGRIEAVWFVGGMLAGMALFALLDRRSPPAEQAAHAEA